VDRRLTATQALEHAWVRPGGTAPDRPLEGTVVRAPRARRHRRNRSRARPLRMPHHREPVCGVNARFGPACGGLDTAGAEGDRWLMVQC